MAEGHGLPSGKMLDAVGELQNDAWFGRFLDVHPNCCRRDHDPAFGTVFESGRGSSLWDVSGQQWIDLTCSFSASNFGHAYEPLVQVAQAQLSRLTQLTGEPHIFGVTLAERLIAQLGCAQKPSKVIFNTTGARAIESSLKAAVSFRPGKIMCLSPGFHGRTVATSALSDTPQATLSDVFDAQCIIWPKQEYPYCLRCPLGLSYPACHAACVDRLLNFIEMHQAQISCLLVEPALGARGYVFPPAEYFQRLRALTKELGILMISDEIQTGLGRCGDWLLSRSQGWEADLVVIGKSLGGGIVPLAAVVGRDDVLQSIPPGAESETFAGNPLACAVGVAVCNLLADKKLFERGMSVGRKLRELVQTVINERDLQTFMSVSGQAASCVVEVKHSGMPPTHDSRRARQLAIACLKQRLRVHLSGPLTTRIVLLPALTMTDLEFTETELRLCEALADFGQKSSNLNS